MLVCIITQQFDATGTFGHDDTTKGHAVRYMQIIIDVPLQCQKHILELISSYLAPHLALHTTGPAGLGVSTRW